MEAEANLDYNLLIQQADKEYDSAMDELTKRLERMSPSEVLKKQAEITESMKTIMSGKPLNMITA